MNRLYPWEEFYEAAILEADHTRLPARVRTAQTAINSRIEQLEKGQDGSSEEREAIACALTRIRILKQERL